ncbi:MAG: hypothetical protein ACLU38_04945 [Dysosmobacter sp.]
MTQASFWLRWSANNVPFLMQGELNNYFINEFQQHIKSSLARAIRTLIKRLWESVPSKNTLATQIQPILQEILNDYGLKLIVFTIAAIDIPENDPNRQKLEEAFANKGVMGILGDDWGRQQATEILHTLAANPGAGGVAARWRRYGNGNGCRGVFAGMAQQMFAPMQPQPPCSSLFSPLRQVLCQRGAANGEHLPRKVPKIHAESLKKLKAMLDAGLIPQDVYNSK